MDRKTIEKYYDYNKKTNSHNLIYKGHVIYCSGGVPLFLWWGVPIIIAIIMTLLEDHTLETLMISLVFTIMMMVVIRCATILSFDQALNHD